VDSNGHTAVDTNLIDARFMTYGKYQATIALSDVFDFLSVP
jgi:hypothetical protein